MSDLFYREAARFFDDRDRWTRSDIVAVIVESGYWFHPDHGGGDLLPEWDETRIIPISARAIRNETKRTREYFIGKFTYYAHQSMAVIGTLIAERGFKKDLRYGRPPYLVPLALKSFAPLYCSPGDTIYFTWDGGIEWEVPHVKP